jgi:hypothetical protein
MKNENVYVIEFTKSQELTEEDITDIVVTALEGGIGYWACLDNTGEEFENAPEDEAVSETVARILLNNGSVFFEDEEARYELTLEKLLNGIEKYARMNSGIDMDDLDADMADVIVQYAIFCEVIYG